jgi:tryptophanyl-tRNA synthetase
MKKRILKGDRPTGPLHIGHYVGSLENRVRLQQDYDCYFIIADYQFLTDHLKETAKTEHIIEQILLDWLSVGMDPAKSTFFIQSSIPEIAELTMYFSMLVSLARVQRNPTVKEEFKNSKLSSMSYGFLGYPISQAADILCVRSHLVPVGDDNLPHVEQAREIARTFNTTFGEVFPIPEALVGTIQRLPGLNGRKMGKSAGNAIFLSDLAAEVTRKVGMAVTDPARIRATDAGHPEICNVYQYHVAFNRNEVPQIDKECRQGSIPCTSCKHNLAAALNTFLDPIREKRAYYEARPAILKNSIQEGNRRAGAEAKKTLQMVRETMHFNYKNLLGGDLVAAR